MFVGWKPRDFQVIGALAVIGYVVAALSAVTLFLWGVFMLGRVSYMLWS